MYRAIKDELKELPQNLQIAHEKDKKHTIIGTTAITSSALGSAAMELVNESLPMEYFAGAGVVGFIGWAVVKVFMIEAESGLEHLLDE